MATGEKRALKVFLCHTSGDKPQVRTLYKHLVVEGVDAWLDKEKLLPGQDWRVEIPRAVQESDVVVVCLSNKSITQEGYIQKEILFALDAAKEKPEGAIFLIPARLEDCIVPDRLSRWQWVDLFEEDGFIKLLRSLKLRADKVGAIITPSSYEYGDDKTERRLDQYYTEGLAAFYTEDWNKACQRFQLILSERPGDKNAIEKFEEAERQRDLSKLYVQSMDAYQAEDWQVAIKILGELLKKASNYKDSAELLKNARKQKQLTELFAEANKLHAAKEWDAVLKVFEQIFAIDPNHPDPSGLLPSAQKEAAELKRLSDLNDLYSQSVREMALGKWYEARTLLEQIHKVQTGFLETESLLRKVENEILKIEKISERNNQISTLYEQAHGLLRSKNWRNALGKIEEIQKLDDQFEDKDGIAEKAKAELEREEQEVQKQNQLAAMYANSVRLLKEGRYQEALDRWNEVRAIDPKYPDRQQVQRIVHRKLAEADKNESNVFKNKVFLIGVPIVLLITVIYLSISFGGGNPPKNSGTPPINVPINSPTKIVLLTVTNVATLSPTQAPLSPMAIATAIAKSTGTQLLYKDFEQPGLNYVSGSGGDWITKVVDGNGLLEVYSPSNGGPGNLPTVVFGSEAWTNYLLGFRFKVTKCDTSGFFGCMIVVTFRNEGGQAYVLLINTNDGRVSLEFGGRDGWTEFNHGTTDKFLSLPLGKTWHDVLLAADREGISVAVDGTWTSAVSDDRLKTGAVVVQVGTNTTAQFDDFNAWNIP